MSTREKRVLDEMKARIPRGRAGDRQNELRHALWFFRAQADSFDSVVAMALAEVRKREPGFVPRIVPA